MSQGKAMLTFRRIGDSDDSLERMLAALRFWFTKDLVSPLPNNMVEAYSIQKYVKGKPVKPYNSTLGEFFRVCHANEITRIEH